MKLTYIRRDVASYAILELYEQKAMSRYLGIDLAPAFIRQLGRNNGTWHKYVVVNTTSRFASS